MSFVVQVWAQPVGLPWPADWFEAEAQREQLQAGTALAPSTARAACGTLVPILLGRLPPTDADPLWLDLPGMRRVDAGLLNIALDAASPRFEAALTVAIQQAQALGLHLADGLSGVVHLADGRVIGEADEVLLMGDPAAIPPRGATGRQAPESPPDWSITIYPELLAEVEPEPEPAPPQAAAAVVADATPARDVSAPVTHPELRRRADAGNARAAFELGLLHHSPPDGADPDFEQAAYWFQRSAEADDPCGACMLGVCLLEGEGLPRDTVRARYWLERSLKFAGTEATSGSLFQLGRMLVAGWGGPADPQRGVQLYLLASAQGHADAIFNLASCLDAGYGCAPDPVAAKALFLRARALGSPLRAPGLRVSRREVETVRTLARRFVNAADIPARLDERRVERELARALRARPAAQRPSAAVSTPSRPLHAGHLALAIALPGLVALAISPVTGAALHAGQIAGLALLGGVATWGAWRVWRGEHSGQRTAAHRQLTLSSVSLSRDSMLTQPG